MKSEGEKITMLHGAGGTVMHDLVKNYVVKAFGGIGNAEVPLEAMDDAAVVGDVVFKSDSHAVKPIFFPGGDIGRIAAVDSEQQALTVRFDDRLVDVIADCEVVLRGCEVEGFDRLPPEARIRVDESERIFFDSADATTG